MEPKELFRTQNGCIFEEFNEAKSQSAEEAAMGLHTLFGEQLNRLTKNGDDLMACNPEFKIARKEINKAFTEFQKALDGKLITKYKISK